MTDIEKAREEILRSFEYIKSIDCEDEQSYESTLEAFLNFRWMPVFARIIPSKDESGNPFHVFRTRTHEKNEEWFFDRKDITFPPNEIVKKYARVNRPFQSVFYGSENRITSYMELVEYWAEENEIGDTLLVTIGMWEFQRDLKLLIIPKPNKEERKTDSEIGYGEMYDHFISNGKFTEIGKELSHLIFGFMFNEFMRPAKNDKKTYMTTSAYSNLIMAKTDLDGILYPSVPFGGEGYNLALKKKIVADGSIKLIDVTRDEFTIYETDAGKHHFFNSDTVSTRNINQATGEIQW